MTAIGINGFGRVGRNVLRASRNNPNFDNSNFEVKLINDPAGVETLAHLLKYDSNYGIFSAEVRTDGNNLVVDGKKIMVSAERDPAKLPLQAQGIQVMLECTGHFVDRASASVHLQAGAKKVLISAPAKDVDITLVKGVNLDRYQPDQHHVISNASCTTNCLAPLAQVLHQNWGISHGLMTTIHAYTNDQHTLDRSNKDLRRARAAALSMIPTTTGAASAIGLVLPELQGKLDGFAIRVPIPTCSVVDFTAILSEPASQGGINAKLKEAAEGHLKGILQYSDEPLVSIDFKGNTHSSILDAPSTKLIGGKMVKLLAWYDNEWGYCNRLAEVALSLL